MEKAKDKEGVAYGLDRASFNQGRNAQFNFSVDEEKIGSIVAKGPSAVCTIQRTEENNAMKDEDKTNYIVRRLTPLECERLQNFPDGWTDIGDWTDDNGKVHKEADTPRYKALGNSIALPFWQYLARRIVAQYEHEVTMGSLFSGIGGFELVFSRCGAEPLWSSEIEPFCKAVLEKRFPEGEETECG